MKNILVPWNVSWAADHACRFAIALASHAGDKVHVAKIINIDFAVRASVSDKAYKEQITMLSELMEKAENDFERLMSRIGIADNKVAFLLEVGPSRNCLLKIICEHKIDLVVVAASEQPEFEQLLSESDFGKITFAAQVADLIALYKS
ncbi:universal stress protein [Dyadobacter sp. NIV53]|uniref:universal stress protein n=1 Tax=Dyadobacter sp. NIV53 TaxID=2861765 RepID=UPI001C87EBE7|nr:universal stress protein [Dyadobacter sp. NIV53]